MSVAVRCLLLLAVLFAGGTAVAPADDARETTRTVAAGLMDTSWGDEYVRPEQ
ncbi:hypothetical protein [Streptomyces sp. NRRL B-24572]|uniref:hypothetical protein n=1 Tax=Streptomyces sp. NRRL B-24572 TaxID=1962156 RepID=UPI0015C50CCF|nr:hypothetical protein [Streptomyces sp. NRRL B-24572]